MKQQHTDSKPIETKKWLVTIVLIVGYYNHDNDKPRLRYDKYEVEAETEKEAIDKAKELDKTLFSVWESYAEKTS